MINFAPREGHGDGVVYARQGSLGRIRLNRPAAINALDVAMVRSMQEQLAEWAGDDSIACLLIDGSGERGLCAGGDIRAMHAAVTTADHAALDFWDLEYKLNATIASYRKPTVALMDGIVMGGGIGVAGYTTLRVVTERSRIAMPETGIGFFPDVGATFLLSRAPHQLGTHLALTGATVDGATAIAAGLADVQADDAEIARLVEHLADGGSLKVDHGSTPPCPLANATWIGECYTGNDAAAIVQRLADHDAPDARAAAEVIRSRSPLSVAVTLAALRRAATMSLVEVLDSDAVLARNFAERSDFAEGVRAQIIDKDRNPRWQHASLAEVPTELVESFFVAA
ncbi:enoyl-CoA hydratase/isomerase family protein [Propionibacteriaceae bacterium Y1700]|uniref:enoyl-CoA hydratase/isomerase family protein n=1 Tax=Microlunatus sp. Y1700 TaxID=3418487 RepID=UPI003DA734C7